MTHGEAIDALRTFAADFDGSIEACFRLDELLWEVRKAHPHNWTTVAADPPNADEIVIDLEELGL